MESQLVLSWKGPTKSPSLCNFEPMQVQLAQAVKHLSGISIWVCYPLQLLVTVLHEPDFF